MPLVEEAIDIKMNPSELFSIISDFERYPEFMENAREVNILEKGEGYTITEWIADTEGRVLKWIEKDHLKPLENRIDFELIKGDLKTFDGFWQLEPNGLVTKVVLSVTFEFGIPMIAPLLHPILAKLLRKNMRQMLTDIKKKAET